MVRLLHQSSLLQVQCFDPKEDQWSLRSPAPFLQRCLEAVSLEDTIYVVGGLMSKIFTYDPGSDVWREAADLPSPVVSGAPGKLLHWPIQGTDSLPRLWSSRVRGLV